MNRQRKLNMRIISQKCGDTVYQQELSYRKQITRQLRTQYVEGINNNPVTLKSRLRVTQDH